MSQTNQITAKKRHRKDLDRERDFDSDSDIEIRSTASAAGVSGAWPRFLLVKVAKDGARLSPFLLEKWFEGVSRQIVNVKRQRDSSYLVDCPSKRVSDNLMARDGTSLNIGSETFGVSVSVHPSLNSSHGVARSYHFEGLSELEIKDGLASQGVTAVHKVLRTDKDGCKVRTNTVFLTFCSALQSLRLESKLCTRTFMSPCLSHLLFAASNAKGMGTAGGTVKTRRFAQTAERKLMVNNAKWTLIV